MNGYEKQRNSLEPPRIGIVQLGDARAWNRGEEQKGKAQPRTEKALNRVAVEPKC
jgi:hypothetical protein